MQSQEWKHEPGCTVYRKIPMSTRKDSVLVSWPIPDLIPKEEVNGDLPVKWPTVTKTLPTCITLEKVTKDRRFCKKPCILAKRRPVNKLAVGVNTPNTPINMSKNDIKMVDEEKLTSGLSELENSEKTLDYFATQLINNHIPFATRSNPVLQIILNYSKVLITEVKLAKEVKIPEAVTRKRASAMLHDSSLVVESNVFTFTSKFTHTN